MHASLLRIPRLVVQSAQEAAAAEAAAAMAEAKRAVDLAASAAELQRRGDDLQARLRPQQTLNSTVSRPRQRDWAKSALQLRQCALLAPMCGAFKGALFVDSMATAILHLSTRSETVQGHVSAHGSKAYLVRISEYRCDGWP